MNDDAAASPADHSEAAPVREGEATVPETKPPSGFKVRRRRIEARVTSTRDRILAARPRSDVLDVAFTAFERDVASGGGVLAGAVAFRVFMFQVPYVFTLVAGFGFASDASDRSATDLARSAGIGGLTAKAFVSVSEASTSARWTILLVGGFALFLAARAAVKVLRIVHSLVWNVAITQMKRATRQAVAFIVLVTIALALTALLGRVRTETFVGYALLEILFTAVPIGLWLFVSYYMPRAEGTTWFELLPGSVLFGVGTQLLHIATVWWIARLLANKTETYGAIGAALVLLLWAYLLGRLMTAGAALNAALWYRSRGRLRRTSAPPSSESATP